VLSKYFEKLLLANVTHRIIVFSFEYNMIHHIISIFVKIESPSINFFNSYHFLKYQGLKYQDKLSDQYSLLFKESTILQYKLITIRYAILN